MTNRKYTVGLFKITQMKKLILALIIFTGCTKEAAKEVEVDFRNDKFEIVDAYRISRDAQPGSKVYKDSVIFIWRTATKPVYYVIYCGANAMNGFPYWANGNHVNAPIKNGDTSSLTSSYIWHTPYKTDLHFVAYYGPKNGPYKDSVVGPVYNITKFINR